MLLSPTLETEPITQLVNFFSFMHLLNATIFTTVKNILQTTAHNACKLGGEVNSKFPLSVP